ncbi:MAG: hypothetical protein K6E40_08675 [Desulfovibrio sp.]|nr:hypothetical protein [Desulfovibrio sp.]
MDAILAMTASAGGAALFRCRLQADASCMRGPGACFRACFGACPGMAMAFAGAT